MAFPDGEWTITDGIVTQGGSGFIDLLFESPVAAIGVILVLGFILIPIITIWFICWAIYKLVQFGIKSYKEYQMKPVVPKTKLQNVVTKATTPSTKQENPVRYKSEFDVTIEKLPVSPTLRVEVRTTGDLYNLLKYDSSVVPPVSTHTPRISKQISNNKNHFSSKSIHNPHPIPSQVHSRNITSFSTEALTNETSEQRIVRLVKQIPSLTDSELKGISNKECARIRIAVGLEKLKRQKVRRHQAYTSN